MSLIDTIKSKIGKKERSYIGIFVSPRSYIEVVEYDTNNDIVKKHGRVELEYDAITRQIKDISDLEINIVKLFDELNIPYNTPAILSMQTVFLGHVTLPMELDDSEIKSVLTEQLESNFLFRNNTPEISYEIITEMQETNTVHLVFTAIQQQQIFDIEGALKKQGLNIVAIDTSYASLLRGLSTAGVCNEDINQGNTWQVLLVNNNSLITLSLIGNRLVDFADTPIAIKSFQPNEISSVIVSYTNDAIANLAPDHLIIISKTDEVSAEELGDSFNLSCKITAIEENKFIKQSLFAFDDYQEQGPPQLVDIETVGAVYWNQSDIPISFNFISKNISGGAAAAGGLSFGASSLEMTPSLFNNILLVAIVLSILLNLGIYLLISSVSSGMEKKLGDLNAQSSQLEEEIKGASNSKLTTEQIISKIFEKNSKILQSYNAVGAVIPEKLWLLSFELKDDFNTNISGKSYSVDDIVAYYQNLLRSAYFQNFKVSAIKVVGDGTQTGGTGDVSIISSGSSPQPAPNALPSIPNLPNSQKYYEFSFGGGNTMSTTVSTDSADPNAAPPPEEPPTN